VKFKTIWVYLYMHTAATPQHLVKVSDKNHYKQLIKKAHTENVVKSSPCNNLRLHLVREKCHCERFAIRYCNWSADNAPGNLNGSLNMYVYFNVKSAILNNINYT